MLRPAACALALAGLFALASCAVLPGGGEGERAPPPARGGLAQRPPPPAAAGVCQARLAEVGAAFTPVPDRYTGEGCALAGTVQLASLASDDQRLRLGNIGPVTCGVSQAFAAWARFGADRAARQILGVPIRSIETFGSYSCRNVAGSGRRSAHATAEAIDISGFVLADGRRITVKDGWDGRSEAERRFLRTVHQSACRRFATVLGPAYNPAHRDHLHLEGVLAGRGFCR